MTKSWGCRATTRDDPLAAADARRPPAARRRLGRGGSTTGRRRPGGPCTGRADPPSASSPVARSRRDARAGGPGARTGRPGRPRRGPRASAAAELIARARRCSAALVRCGDGVVVEVVGADLDRHRPFGQEEADAPGRRVEGRGRVALGGPALAEDRVGGLGRRAAQRHAEREEVPDEGGDDLVGGLLGGGDDDDAGGPAPRDQVPQSVSVSSVRSSSLPPACRRRARRWPRRGGRTRRPARSCAGPSASRTGVAAVHLGAEVLEDLDGALHVGPDEVLGRAGPGGELDLLAVEEGQVDVRGRGRPRR